MEESKTEENQLGELMNELGLTPTEKKDLLIINKLLNQNENLISQLNNAWKDLRTLTQKLDKRVENLEKRPDNDNTKKSNETAPDFIEGSMNITKQKQTIKRFIEVHWRKTLIKCILEEKEITRPRAGEVTGHDKRGLSYISSQIKPLKDAGIIDKEEYKKYVWIANKELEEYTHNLLS